MSNTSVVVHPAGQPATRRPSGRREFGPTVRRIGLGVFFASVAANAALGIYALVTPGFEETERNILLTSLCVTGAVLLALACEPAWERRLLGPVPLGGAVVGMAAFALAIGAIWTDGGSDPYLNALGSTSTVAVACTAASLVVLVRLPAGHEWVVRTTLFLVAAGAAVDAVVWWLPGDETAGRAMGSTMTIGAACAVAMIVARARLAPGHEWVFRVALGLLAIGASLLAGVYWFGDDVDDVYARAMGVVLVGFAAFAVTVPVLHWLDRGARLAAEALTGAVQFCPHCGKRLAGEAGVELACARCGRHFTVT